jgi:CRP/FNR family cyclic AMP-dependent transcriptional regulator
MIPRMALNAVAALSQIPLFEGIERKDLERLARSFRERSFPEGQTVTKEGEPGTGFFVILEGSAHVSVHGRTVATLGPGEALGEMALLDEGPRSATVVAATDLHCIGLTPWEFRAFVEEHPSVAWALLQTLARRLRAAEA